MKHFEHLQTGCAGKPRHAPSQQNVSVVRASTTQITLSVTFFSMGYLIQPPDILKKPVNDVIALVENKEMARNALPSSTLSAMSFQRQKNPPTSPTAIPPQVDQTKEAICPDCKHTFKVFTEGARGWNTKPHQMCINCYRACRKRNRPLRSPLDPKASLQAIEQDPISQVAAFQRGGPPQTGQR